MRYLKMDARAIAKYVRISGRKVNKYGKSVKSLRWPEAGAALMLDTSRGARVLYGVMQSAVANLIAKNKNIDEENVMIDKITVDEGPTLKRWRPRARGRADRIRKRTCHIEVTVSGDEIKK
jgi:large subunit ribosomal protein L22